MYSKVFLTDDNFDEELEKLCEFLGMRTDSFESFVEKLDKEFSLQLNKGKEEWIRYRTIPNKGNNLIQAFQKGQLAYEFGNGFIILNFEQLL